MQSDLLQTLRPGAASVASVAENLHFTVFASRHDWKYSFIIIFNPRPTPILEHFAIMLNLSQGLTTTKSPSAEVEATIGHHYSLDKKKAHLHLRQNITSMTGPPRPAGRESTPKCS